MSKLRLFWISVFLVMLLGIFIKELFYASENSYAAAPADQFGLSEGDLIRSGEDNDTDIYTINEHGYKRLFLNPAIFSFYGHLGGFEKVKLINRDTRDAFETSSLLRNCESGDKKVYNLELTGEDEGVLHWVNVSGSTAVSKDSDFFKKVFCINSREFKWYRISSSYTSLSQIPDYSFSIPVSSSNIAVDLKINGSDNPGPIEWNSVLNAKWTSQNAIRCAGFHYVAIADKETNIENLPTQGESILYGRNTVPSDMKSITVQVLCYDANDAYADDYVTIPIKDGSAPVIKNIAISNMEIQLGKTYQITWESKNLNSGVNIILGKGENGKKGQFWYIAKDAPNTGNYEWGTSIPLEPATGRGTTSANLEPASNYYIYILDSEETFFNSSSNGFKIL